MAFHNSISEGEGWGTLASDELYANPYVKVRKVRVKTPSRPEGMDWTVVHRRTGCVVAPLTERGTFVLVQQERLPVRTLLWEFPAGQIDEEGELSETIIQSTAHRELLEETGFVLAEGGKLIPLGSHFPSSGFTDEMSYLFLATPVVPSPTGPKHDESEAIVNCREFTPQEVREMIAQNVIRDANTLATFSRLVAMGLFPGIPG